MRKRMLFCVPLIVVLLVACGSDDPAEQAQPTSPANAEGTAGDGGVAGGTSMSAGSCVERYSIETLKNRDYAFDGTIKSITPDPADGPSTVVFDVRTWFKGGTGAEATRKAHGFGQITSAGGTDHQVGDRLLIAGDEDFIWECGFTQVYHAEVAAD